MPSLLPLLSLVVQCCPFVAFVYATRALAMRNAAMATLPAPCGRHHHCRRLISPPAARPATRRAACGAYASLRATPSPTVGREAAVARMPRLAHRDVMLSLAREAEARLGARLLPSQVPADAADFSDDGGRALGSVDVRRGAPGSSIDFMLEAWFHRALPGGDGRAIDITSLIVFLNGATDAPRFLMELIQGGPSSLVLLLDLFPRRDLPLHPGYIDTYYAATGVDEHRRDIVERVPQVRPYVSPSLLVRSLWSPTAVVVDVQCGEGGAAELDEIVRGQIATSAAAVLDVWIERCAGSVVEMDAAERERLVARDKMIATTSVELNLSANLPKMFSADVSGRVVAEISKAFVGSS